MRILALIALVVLVPAVVFGITQVPRHDGRLTNFVIEILLPTAGVCWAIRQILPQPKKPGETRKEKGT